MNAREYLKGLNEHDPVWDTAEEYEYTEDQLINFAERYHEKQLKLLRIGVVSKRYFLFSGQEDCKPTKYLVDDCDDRETAIAKIETEYPNFKWVMTEAFNAC